MEINSIVQKINTFNTMEEAKAYIESLKLSKGNLLKISKTVDANVSQKDNKAKIIDWIINATIGLKLKCEAIAEIDLSR